MRLLRLSVLVLILGSSSAHAQAVQRVRPADLVGKWKGPVVLEGVISVDRNTGAKTCGALPYGWRTWYTDTTNPAPCTQKGIGVLMLRPDSLWWERQSPNGTMSGDWAIESAGRWRVAGDTLWLLTAPEYGQWAGLQSSLGRSVTDTVGAGRLPKHDPLFWSKVSPAMVHKVTLTGNQLSLFSFDSLAKNPQAPAHGVYMRVDTDSANGRHP